MKKKVTDATKLRRAKLREAGLCRRLGEVEAKLMIANNTKNKLKKIIEEEIKSQGECKDGEHWPPKTVMNRLAYKILQSEMF